MASADTHKQLAERYERAAVYWDEHGDHEQAEVERANARMEREQAELIAHPKQKTQPKNGEPVEIPIPTREAFLRDLEKVAPANLNKPPADSDTLKEQSAGHS